MNDFMIALTDEMSEKYVGELNNAMCELANINIVANSLVSLV
jgi:hypothetical protein